MQKNEVSLIDMGQVDVAQLWPHASYQAEKGFTVNTGEHTILSLSF